MEQINELIELHGSQGHDDSNNVSDINAALLTLLSSDDNAPAWRTTTATKFWSNICHLIGTCEPNGVLLWTAVGTIEHGAKWPALRQFLVHTMHVIPLLGELILRCTKAPAPQQRRLLLVLDRLCAEDYRSAGDGLVFFPLVRQLLKCLHAHARDGRAADLALSALASLCDRNKSVLLHLLHQEQTGTLETAMQALPVQSVRMQIVLVRNTAAETGNVCARIPDLMPNVLKCISAQLQQIASTTDALSVQHLRYLVDSAHEARQSPNIRPNEELIAEIATAFRSVLSAVHETQKQLQQSTPGPSVSDRLEAQLQLCRAVVQLTGPALSAHYNQLVNIILARLESTTDAESSAEQITTASALDVLRTIVRYAPSVASVFSEPLLTVLRQRLGGLPITTSVAGVTLTTLELLRLLEACFDAVPTTAVDVIAPDALGALWKPLEEGHVNPYRLAPGELRAYVHGLHLLHRCSEYEPTNRVRSDIVQQLLAKRPILCVLMLGARSTDAEMLRLVYNVMRSSYFPVESFADLQAPANQRWYPSTGIAAHQSQPGATTDTRYPAGCCSISAPHATRLQQLLDKVQATLDHRSSNGSVGDQQQQSFGGAHIVELYRHKVRDTEQREQRLLHSHQAALRSIIQLQQALEQQSATLRDFEAIIFEKVATQEMLRKGHTQLTSAVTKLRERLDRLEQRGDQERRESTNRMKIAETEIQNYKKQIEIESQKVEAEEKRRQREAKENMKKIETLTQSIGTYEERLRKVSAELEQVTAENEENIKLRDAIMKMIQRNKS